MSHPKKRNYLKMIGLFILSAIIFIFLIFLAAPAILSTKWGQARLLKKLNAQIPGKVSAQEIRLSWLGKQQVIGLSLQDVSKNEILSIENVELDSPLINFLLRERRPVKAVIQNLNAKIIHAGDGGSNLMEAFGLASPFPGMDGSSPLIEVKETQGSVQYLPENSHLVIRLIGQTISQSEQGSFDIDMTLNGLNLERVEKMRASIDNLPVALIEQFTALNKKDWEGLALMTFGKKISLLLDQQQGPEGAELRLKIDSPNLSASLIGNLKDNQFFLKEPGIIDFVLTPEFLNHWFAGIEIKLEQATHLHLTIENLTLPLKNFSEATIQTSLHLPAAKLGGIPFLNQIDIHRVQADLRKDSANPLIHLKINGESNQNQKQAIFALSGHFDHQSKDYEAIVTADPLHLKELPGIGDIVLQETRLHLSHKNSAERQVRLTAHVAPLSRNQYLKSSFPVEVFLSSVGDLQAEGKLKIKELTLGSAGSPSSLFLRNLDIPWQFNAHKNQFKVNLFAEMQISNQNLTRVSGEGHLFNFFKNGHLSLREISAKGMIQFEDSPSGQFIAASWDRPSDFISLQSRLKRFPAFLLYKMSGLEASRRAKLETAFGPIVDVSLEVQLHHRNGPVKISLAGSNGLVNLDGNIHNDFLSLNSPFYAEVEASPALSENLLQDIIPLLGGMTRADDRLRVAIDPSGFQMSLSNINLDNIQIGQLTFELGNAYFDGYGQVASILKLLKAVPDEEFSVWFTPIYLSIQNGRVDIQRFDMLAMGTYPIAAWGAISIPEDYIDMRIGLNGASLQQAVGVPIPDRNLMMQFPLKGRIGHAKIDKSKVAAKIAALAASATGPQGLVLGAVIGFASGAFNEDPIPPPTTNPLPWDQGQDGGSIPSGGTIPNPLKSIQKGAKNLLKSIFR